MRSILFVLALLALLLLVNCTTKPIYHRGPLKEQVLRPRTGYEGRLTNKRCIERKKYSEECLKFDVVEYDLNRTGVRNLLRDLKFVCNVRGARFVPCEKSTGICQLHRVKVGWGKYEIQVKKYLSMNDDYGFLVGADTYCASIDSTVGRQMFDSL